MKDEPWVRADMPDEIVVELRPLGRSYPTLAVRVWRDAKRLGTTEPWEVRKMAKDARPPPGTLTDFQWTWDREYIRTKRGRARWDPDEAVRESAEQRRTPRSRQE